MSIFDGYCVKCHAIRAFKAEPVVSASGRRMANGPCPTCNTTMHRILGKVEAAKEPPSLLVRLDARMQGTWDTEDRNLFRDAHHEIVALRRALQELRGDFMKVKAISEQHCAAQDNVKAAP